MTYGCEHLVCSMLALDGAAVSHLAELVRGEFRKAPSSGPSRHLLPKVERGATARFGVSLRPPSKQTDLERLP
jgi:hypothetical protein